MKISIIQSNAFGPGNCSSPSIISRFLAWLDRIHDRAALHQAMRQMDEHVLRDIGINRADIEAEFEKPFWRV